MGVLLQLQLFARVLWRAQLRRLSRVRPNKSRPTFFATGLRIVFKFSPLLFFRLAGQLTPLSSSLESGIDNIELSNFPKQYTCPPDKFANFVTVNWDYRMRQRKRASKKLVQVATCFSLDLQHLHDLRNIFPTYDTTHQSHGQEEDIWANGSNALSGKADGTESLSADFGDIETRHYSVRLDRRRRGAFEEGGAWNAKLRKKR